MKHHLLQLPPYPVGLPSALQNSQHTQSQPLPPHITTPSEIQQALATVLTQQDHGHPITDILGSDQTPSLLWLLASHSLPQATPWYYSHASQQWLHISPDTAPQPATAPPEASPEPPTPETTAAPAPATAADEEPRSIPARSPALQDMPDGKLLFDAFLFEAWGRTPDHIHALERIEEEAGHRGFGLLDRVRKSRLCGEKAHQLSQQLEQEIRQHGIEHGRQWLAQQSGDLHEHIRQHLKTCLRKLENWHQKQKERQAHRKQQGYQSNLRPVTLIDGHHPNSLPHLPPSRQWQILIDETGDTFDETAENLAPTDRQVGRLVALAIPAGTKLPALKNFHATEKPSHEVDEVLQRLLERPVGIFGFAVTDPAARHRHWIGHIQHLITWTLLQLPIPDSPADNDPVIIEALIENRSNYQTGDDRDLRALNESLESELQRIDPARFAHLLLRLQIIDKQQPRNGYVDTIAFTWGSPATESKDRLKKSALRGHCLLNANEAALQRLYLALSDQRKLPPVEWYELCTAASTDPEGGYLRRSLDRIGTTIQQHPSLWRDYLEEVRQRLRTKQYRLAELGHALDWLQRHAPQGQNLPAPLRLQLESTRLATQNHLGQTDLQRISDCLDLIRKLHDETPDQACEALLRIATATTNVFEFDILRETIGNWLKHPIAVPGLLNHGKLHSTLGQIEAFGGQPAKALPHFDQAIASFDCLSDPEQQQRETSQTRTYRLIARLDTHLQVTNNAQASELLAELVQHAHTAVGKNTPEAISRSLAHNGQDHRYLHHLWLRAMLHLSGPMQGARQAYLQSAGQWQQAHTDHPWPLITAYRGWLLLDDGQSQAATEQLQHAINTCAHQNHGPTLQWMAEVLRTLALALGLNLPEHTPSTSQRQYLHQQLPHAPHQALADFVANASNTPGRALPHQQLLQHLCACLPFNFH